MVDAVVIGAGHCGLAVSRHLSLLGVEHLVLEAGRVGESWRSQRWDSFALNTPTWATRLPGDDVAADPEPQDGFLHRDAWVGRLEAYAATHAVPVRTGVRVTGVSPDASGGSQVATDDPAVGTIAARAMVVASGMQRVPKLPSIAAAVPTGVASLHTADYRSPDALPPGGVLVVGAAQSGGAIAEELLEAGRSVVLAASAAPRLPRRYRGRDIFEWLRDSGFLRQTVDQLPDPRMQFAPQPIISGVGRYGHTLSLQGLAARGAVLAGRLVGFDGSVAHFGDDLAASIRVGDGSSMQVRANVDRAIDALGAAVPPPDPDPDDVPVADPDGVAAAAPRSLDLARARIGTVIWATGFGADVAWLGPRFLGPGGVPVQVEGRSSVSGVWFLGIPWQRSRASAIIGGADEDGAFVAGEVAAHLAGAAAG